MQTTLQTISERLPQRPIDIRDFGAAEGNSATENAAAIQAALDTARKRGLPDRETTAGDGGSPNGSFGEFVPPSAGKMPASRHIVVVPPGTWHTGTLWLRSHVELRLEKGAVLKASTRPEDYNANDAFPENFWSVGEEWSGGHLLLGYQIKDAAITGEGSIDGSGLSFFGEPDEDSRFPHYKYGLRLHPLDRAWFRPGPLVAFFLSKGIRLDGVSIVDSPCWTTHFRCCDGVDIRGVSIRNDRTVANTDGFSIDCSRNVSVSGCTVVTGDDAVAIRASCGLHAAEHPCENVVVENCDFASCAMGVRIGIGSGTIRDVTVRNCVVREAANGIKFHPAWIPGAKGCYIENIRVEDCDIAECDYAVNSLCGADDWRIRDIVFERCKFATLQPATFRGDAAHHPENVVFRDCSRRHLDHLKVRHHRGYGGERSRKFLQIEGEADVRLENCSPNDNPHGTLVLSFDDRNFADWLAAMPLFAKYGAHATFFVSGEIDAEAQQTMKRLAEAGHSVGLHGLRHLNADEALDSMGAERYWKEEIEPQLCVCRVGYIPVSSFAYPNCRRDDATDGFFREHGVRHVRGGLSGIAPYDPDGTRQEGLVPIHTVDRAFVPAEGLGERFRIDTVIAGEAYHTGIDDILACIRRAAERREAFVLTSHGIHPDAHHIHMKTEWLERILATAKECGVAVVGFDEL